MIHQTFFEKLKEKYKRQYGYSFRYRTYIDMRNSLQLKHIVDLLVYYFYYRHINAIIYTYRWWRFHYSPIDNIIFRARGCAYGSLVQKIVYLFFKKYKKRYVTTPHNFVKTMCLCTQNTP